MLKKAVAWLALFAPVQTLLRSAPAAAGKAAREIVQYRDEPRNGKACVNCWAYVNGPAAGEGTCKVVEGPISPNGWCMAFSPRHEQKKSRAIAKEPGTAGNGRL
ncbi:MAG TPA: high-potential iron-sulfur protein [Burkholderiales bacterium]|nr:high-potential iron-sulfur protein [Burkholderiales bacterium]